MKTKIALITLCAMLAFCSCKGGKDTPAGDSTGTGAGGARVPGMTTSDTTKYDTNKTAADSTKADTGGK